jgi:hypothetical protein
MRTLVGAIACIALGTSAARAQNALTITEVKLDRATLHTIGVQVLINGDANRNAEIRVTVKPEAGGETVTAPPLFRVLPETVTGRTVPEQFAGTIFDVQPGSTYEVTLDVTDPDGGSDTRTVMATTRAWPADPASGRAVAVATSGELQAALAAAQPGDLITLATGTYTGTFAVNASGTAAEPIIVRGVERDTVILDGDNCTGCNILEVYGSHVRVQDLTIRNGTRALRFLGNATTANAALRLRIDNVQHGIGSGTDQTDFTICDNIVHGRLAWPLIYTDDMAAHADDQGIRVDGSGHVVCHNDITGFGDPMINFTDGGRAYDFYGNDIHEIYADGTELDRAEGNVRLWGNRWTNVFTAISIQPAYGGPVYVLRNEVLNVADEQIKLKSVGGTIEPSGVLVYHNTFVSPERALNLQTPITQHNFVIANNLFVGPDQPNGRAVEWTAKLDRGTFDSNGYYPDSGYWFGSTTAPRTFATLAEAQAAGVEQAGRVLSTPIFASGTAPPASYTMQMLPPDFALDAASNALDAGLVLPGINSNHAGMGPDLGAREQGCTPTYGPRPPDDVLRTNPVDCKQQGAGGGDDGGTQPPGMDSTDGGCCGSSRDPRGALVLVMLVALGLQRARRARSSVRS